MARGSLHFGTVITSPVVLFQNSGGDTQCWQSEEGEGRDAGTIDRGIKNSNTKQTLEPVRAKGLVKGYGVSRGFVLWVEGGSFVHLGMLLAYPDSVRP